MIKLTAEQRRQNEFMQAAKLFGLAKFSEYAEPRDIVVEPTTYGFYKVVKKKRSHRSKSNSPIWEVAEATKYINTVENRKVVKKTVRGFIANENGRLEFIPFSRGYSIVPFKKPIAYLQHRIVAL